MSWIAIINSIICVLGTVFGFFLATGSIISIANMKVPWSGGLLVAAFLIPGLFIVSAIGIWPAVLLGSHVFTIGLIALPWLYILLFSLIMILSLR